MRSTPRIASHLTIPNKTEIVERRVSWVIVVVIGLLFSFIISTFFSVPLSLAEPPCESTTSIPKEMQFLLKGEATANNAFSVNVPPGSLAIEISNGGSSAFTFVVNVTTFNGSSFVLWCTASSSIPVGGPAAYYTAGTTGAIIEVTLQGNVPAASAKIQVYTTSPRKVLIPDGKQPVSLIFQAKSFIRRIATDKSMREGTPDYETFRSLGFENADPTTWAMALKLLSQTDLHFSESPPDGTVGSAQFRLWSSLPLSVTCSNDNNISITNTELQTKVGKEGNLSATEAVDVPVEIKEIPNSSPKTYFIKYRFKGRPNSSLLPVFNAIQLRLCPWIWHELSAQVLCDQNKIVVCANLKGSGFPSRRLWVNGTVVDDYYQGPFDRLWECKNKFTSDGLIDEGPSDLGLSESAQQCYPIRPDPPTNLHFRDP